MPRLTTVIAQPRARGAAASSPPARSAASYAGWIVVAGAVAWNLVSLRAQTLSVAYLDDSSVHEQMVRFAAAQFGAGHLPILSWFPYLGLGSAQFLHYQSLPSMLAGLLGLLIGPDAAFRWTLYVLWSLWPVTVYVSARLFGAGRGVGAVAGALSPFLTSVTGVGYEQEAYVWIGYGVWTQLWASMTLPLAWALSWRTIRTGRGFLASSLLIALTAALHFETGYLAFLPLLIWPLVAGVRAQNRRVVTHMGRLAVPTVGLSRALVVGAGAALACAWVIVPLIAERSWAATNEILAHTALVSGYGAPRLVGWLLSGQLLDAGRLPVVSALAGLGALVAIIRWRRDAFARAWMAMLVASLLLASGRTTFGSLADVIPGSADLFFRRFAMGTQLAALLLAGYGTAACARLIWQRLRSRRIAAAVVALAAAAALLVPLLLELGSYDRRDANAIAAQRAAERVQGAELGRLLDVVRRAGGGRVYAGMPSNWGMRFTVGQVPVFKYLEREDVDEVGYTLRTASLMTDPEYFFDERVPADYVLFGVRYLILPRGWKPPVPARPEASDGPYALWSLPTGGYLHVGELIGTLAADRGNVGRRSLPLLRSPLAQRGLYLRVAYGAGHAPGPATMPTPHATRGRGAAGLVLAQDDRLAAGQLTATLAMHRAGTAVLSASFDGGWTASVDGRPRPTVMVAPALVGVNVGRGTHAIRFAYRGYGHLAPLFALSGLSLLALALLDLRRRRPRARANAGSASAPECPPPEPPQRGSGPPTAGR